MRAIRTSRIRRTAVAVTAAVALPFALAACSDDSGSADAGSDSSSTASEKPEKPEEDTAEAEATTAAGPFGPGCAAVPEDGEGSFDGMAKAPVATAASNNPALSTLVTAVKKAGLVDTLNSAENITVFAPTNDAFAKIPKADLEKVLNDKETLTKILTNHVVGEPLKAPADLENGSYETLAKTDLTTAGSGESFKVNDSAQVVCGNVETANADVHIIDTVLMP
ncbi:MAG TPA: fasciclin [Streptomyces sp.]|nr:fasciclin [Streptomyces sp.]